MSLFQLLLERVLGISFLFLYMHYAISVFFSMFSFEGVICIGNCMNASAIKDLH